MRTFHLNTFFGKFILKRGTTIVTEQDTRTPKWSNKLNMKKAGKNNSRWKLLNAMNPGNREENDEWNMVKL